MGSWRRQKGEIHYHAVQGTRSHNKKPPQASWQPTVPSWEKKFCSSIGSVPWRKLLETKSSMYLYDNVVQWNDSAGEEAFHNAKNRFWAEINGLHCDISLPDPDIYIDEIDWNSGIDPELLLDLDREPNVPDVMDNDEKVVLLENTLLLDPSFSCTGWGDVEEEFQKSTENVNNEKNPWEHTYVPDRRNMEDNGWGNCGNDSWGWNQWEDDNNNNENNYKELNNADDKRNDQDWGTWDRNSRETKGTSWHMSRYKTSRFYGDVHPMDSRWLNERGRKREGTGCHRFAHVGV
ncbi:hypothetical protein CFOL_v3_25017 [Cephalotus follicularis]|uniref:Uncharacterized protein n=1 Tax=Cephalotus follicularis TaxID=3775 RepID=A0A1Q3CN94_CEPFO|nr:hypothetical protein CFOL_v3_25017 [Cephalotus follicularis]